MELSQRDITYCKNVGAKRADILRSELGVRTAMDLLRTYPYKYIDRSRFYRIAELDGGGLYLHDGNYAYYLEQKAARLEMESAQARKRSAILRRELEWIRRGAQARSTTARG